MDYSIKDLIGMLKLAVIVANGNEKDKVEIPKDVTVEMIFYLEYFKGLLED